MEDNKDFRNYYEILETIKEDCFTIVYKAKHKISKDLRAIKLIKIEKIFMENFYGYLGEKVKEEIKSYQDRILNGIKIMKLIQDKSKNKDNIVRFYEYFINKKEIVIVMELCDTDLFHFLAKEGEGLKPEVILEILTQLNNTFKIFYENKIIYKNLDLGNIFLKYKYKENIKFKISLVGYLKINTDELLDRDVIHYYYAPEILKEEKYNQECDLWSLGVLIYQLYFRHFPYRGFCDDNLLTNIMNLGSKCIKKTGNKDLDDLISKLLVSDPKKRITWKDYFEHPFFKKNCKDNSKNEEINEIKKLLQNEKNKNDDLIKKINKLESELKEEKNKYKLLEERLKLELDKTNKIQGLDNKLNNCDSKELLYKIILEKDERIEILEKKLKRYPYELNEGEKLITVNFISTDQNIQNYSIICKNTEIFSKIEKKFYEDFKEYSDTHNFFTFNENRVNKLKTLKENGIKNNDIVVINVFD